MINIDELKPSTVETLKNIHTKHNETIKYMEEYGTSFEKAIAALILAASGED